MNKNQKPPTGRVEGEPPQGIEEAWEVFRKQSWPDRQEEWSSQWKDVAIKFAAYREGEPPQDDEALLNKLEAEDAAGEQAAPGLRELRTEILRVEKFRDRYPITKVAGWSVLVEMANKSLDADVRAAVTAPVKDARPTIGLHDCQKPLEYQYFQTPAPKDARPTLVSESTSRMLDEADIATAPAPKDAPTLRGLEAQIKSLEYGLAESKRQYEMACKQLTEKDARPECPNPDVCGCTSTLGANMFAAIVISNSGAILTLGSGFRTAEEASERAEKHWQQEGNEYHRVYVVLDLANPCVLGGRGPNAAFVNYKRIFSKPQIKWGGSI